MIERVSVVGLGKLGACVAASVAHKGFPVISVDADAATVAQLSNGVAPVREPGLQDLVAANRERLRATTDVGEAVRQSDLTFIVVPTPSAPEGGFDTGIVAQVCGELGHALRAKDAYHIVGLCSTVLPGDMETEVLPALEAASHKRCGRDFGLAYNPQFIALGSVIHDFLNPDIMLIGESDPRTGDELQHFYERVFESQPAICRMNFVNAELTKIAINTYITTKISFANTIADLCERLVGGDANVVLQAVGGDSRIGRKYLRGGAAYGGPCFPRDNRALGHTMRSVGVPALLAEATDRVNRLQLDQAMTWVSRWTTGRVGILGLSYKPHTPVTEEAHGVLLASEAARRGLAVTVYDPEALEDARRALGDTVAYARTAAECVRECGTVVVATPWPEFRNLPMECFRDMPAPGAVLDVWGVVEEVARAHAAHYQGRGMGPREKAVSSPPAVRGGRTRVVR